MPVAQPRRALHLRRPAGGGRSGASLRAAGRRSRACSPSTGSSCRRVHTFTLADSENWFALAVYLATAVVVSELAARARRRAAAAEQRERESALLAELATELLARTPARRRARRDRRAARPRPRRRPSARIELGPPDGGRGARCTVPARGRGPPRRHDLHARPMPTRTLAVRQRFLPALAALLAVAVERERLEQRGARGRDAAPQRPRQDGAAPRRLPRPALAADGDPHRGRRAPQRDARASATTTARELLETIDLDVGAGSTASSATCSTSRGSRRARAAPEPRSGTLDELVRDAVDDARRGSDRVDIAGETPLVNVDAVPDPARAREPDRERAQVLAARRAGARPDHRDAQGGDRPRRRPGAGARGGELERVFEPFYRERRRQRSGAGLGLAIARGFAEANGGRVWAESRPGQGATFALALPVVDVPAELPA